MPSTTTATPARVWKLLIFTLLALAVALAGCSDDDDGDDNPTNPGSDDEFTQQIAVSQAQLAVAQATALVQTVPLYAGGIGGKVDGDYTFGWNAETEQWEATYTFGDANTSYDWFYSVQYRDLMGDPQQEAAGAESLRYTQDGTVEFLFEDTQGGTIDWTQIWEQDVTLTGLSLAEQLMSGSGSISLDWQYVGTEANQSYDLLMSWQTTGSGLVVSSDGCPTGTMRFSMPPYQMDVVFDGTATATYTMVDGNGNAVPGGSGTTTLSCGR
jgi:hypothetical protein